MKFFQLIPDGTNIPFVEKRRVYAMGSVFAILATIAMLVFNYVQKGSALNFGIDFAGGSQIRLEFSRDVDVQDVREIIDGAGYRGGSAVLVPDSERQILIRVADVLSISDEKVGACKAALSKLVGTPLADDAFDHPADSNKIFARLGGDVPPIGKIDRVLSDAGCKGQGEILPEKDSLGRSRVEFTIVGIGQKVVDDLDDKLGKGAVFRIVSAETVGAKVGDQLKIQGAQSLLYSIGLIFLYVMIRFDLRFAPGGILALAHDGFLVVGLYAVTWREFSLLSVTAVLTIIGYSINDTIVIFDRIRERIALDRNRPIPEITNVALNDTLSRTVLTSGTTLIVLISIATFGTGSIVDFALALIVGIVVGTYSSLFIASPVFLWINERFYQGQGHLIGVRDAATAVAQRTPTLGAPGSDDPFTQPEMDVQGPGASASDDDDDKPRASRRRRRRPQDE